MEKEITVSQFKYRSSNGWIEAYVVLPKSNVPLPVIIFCRGGTGDYGAVGQRIIRSLLEPLARSGFAVFCTQYSGGPNSEGKDQYGGDDVNDVIDLLKYIRESDWNLDLSKIGLLGISRGALSGLQAVRQGMKIQRAAFVSGMYDVQNFHAERPDIYKTWGDEKMFDVTNTGEIKKRSVTVFAHELPNIPYLILHSKGDTKTPYIYAEQMKKLLGEKATLVTIEGDDHGLISVFEERNKLIIDWFKKM